MMMMMSRLKAALPSVNVGGVDLISGAIAPLTVAPTNARAGETGDCVSGCH